ncbi:MAG: hypothetical protein ACI9FR_003020 [Cryomorphaceae bacterium]|jgi:hypothetical protein
MQRKASPNHNFTDNNEIKNVVTPFAFSVAEELLGQPLASPRRRAVAILLDLLVIAVLTLISSLYLSIAVFLIAARTYYSIRHEEGSTGVRISLAVAMLIALLTIGWQLLWTQGVNVGDTEITVGATAAEAALSTDSSFTDWLKEYLDDFGLSFGWAALYFTVLTAWWNGQTLGKKIMAIKVVRIDGKKIDIWESFGRYGGYSAGVATGLMGFFQVYWDANRQAIHDKISETLVIRT